MSGFIGYKNLLKDGVVTASSEAAGFDKENAFDDRPFDWWQPSATGNATLTLALSTAATADYFAVAAHDMGDNGSRCRLEYDDAGTWTDASGVLAPGAGESVVSRFAPISDTDWRAKFYAKQNLLIRTEQFDNAAWTKTRATITANAITAPDGAVTGDKFVESADSGTHAIEQALTMTANEDHVYSVYANASDRSHINVFIFNATDGVYGNVTFNVSSGTIHSTSAGVGSIEDAEDGWYRCSVKVTPTVGAGNTAFLFLHDGTSTSYAGDGSSGLYIWGAQIEEAPSVGPYQVTTSAAVINSIGNVGHVTFGDRLDITTGQNVGFSPGQYQPDDKILNSESNGKILLGRSLERHGSKMTVGFRNLAPTWVRDNWKPLYDFVSIKPFIVAWDFDAFPLEVSYAWTIGKISGPVYTTPLLMNFSLNVSSSD